MSSEADTDWSDVQDLVAQRRPDDYSDSSWQADVADIRQLLAAADRPLTRRDVQMECHHTKNGTVRRLNYLIDQGDVARVEDPDDGRLVRYALQEGADGDD